MMAIRSTFLLSVFLLSIGLLDAKNFYVFWNIPTFMCKRHGIDFTNLNATYGIYQNSNDTFRGDVVSIMYDPGKFPAILENPSRKNKYYLRNGGVPQEGDLIDHMDIYRIHVDELIPDINFSGIAVIDFESWRPIYRQNFGSLQPYKDLSMKIEKERHPFWTSSRHEQEATRRWELAAKDFMDETLKESKRLRPYAKWGYYAFPYCFNNQPTTSEDCTSIVQKENNQIQWLFKNSDIIFPSVYLRESITPKQRLMLVRGRVKEAVRVAKNVRQTPPVLTYIRYVYTDTLKFLTEDDWINSLQAMQNLGSDGVILWGSSNDLNTKLKCMDFKTYLDNTLGPILQSLQQKYSVKHIPNK